MSKCLIRFDRVGRHGGRSGSPAPAPIVRTALSGDQLADSIALYARDYIASDAFEVVVDLEAMTGQIFAGFRDVGTSTVELVAGGAA